MKYPTEHVKKIQEERKENYNIHFEFVHPSFCKPGINGKTSILNYTVEIFLPKSAHRGLVELTAYWEFGHDPTIICVLAEDFQEYKTGAIVVTDLYPHNGGWVAVQIIDAYL